MGSTKAEIRHRLLSARRLLTVEQRREKSRRIWEKLEGLSPFQNAPLICSYLGFGEEVETADAVRTLLGRDRRVAVPWRDPERGTPHFSEIREWGVLTPNSLGILEPGREHLRIVPTPAISLFLVPGVAFDNTGGRLGYGLGFYDRALDQADTEALLIGLSFDLQVVDGVPVTDHDIPMNLIITETRTINASLRARSTEEVC